MTTTSTGKARPVGAPARRGMRVDKFIERFLFKGRWLLVPMYVGLVGAMGLLLYKFAAEFFYAASGLARLSERQILLSVLGLIDVTLVANLLLMVIFSGYENFVSRFDVGGGDDRPVWMGHLDFTGLKLKLLGAIVAISAIDLLRAFMNVAEFGNQELAWKVGLQLVFIACGVLFALMDRIAAQAKLLEAQLTALDRPRPLRRRRTRLAG